MPLEVSTLSRDQIPHVTANLVAALVQERATRFETTVIAMSGGRTMTTILKVLAYGAISPELWEFCHVVLTDEFIPSAIRPKNNAAELREGFFDEAVARGIVREDQLHWLDLNETMQIPDATKRYEKEVLSINGGVDAVIMGSGGGPYWPGGAVDPGHCMGMMPGHHELWEPNAPMFSHIINAPKPPAVRVTGTAQLVRKAQLACGLIVGVEKANALANFLNTKVPPVHCPIKVLEECERKAVLLTNLQILEV